MAAGLASTLAAAVTSRFGVAGTLIGAGLTAMLVTGASAILRSYLESAAGKMRDVPSRLRTRGGNKTAVFGGGAGRGGRLLGRLRSALGWFVFLPSLKRRSILMGALMAAIAAFVIGMGIVTAAELGIGNSLPCGLWGKCPVGAAPGIHIADGEAGAGSSITAGRARANTVTPQTNTVDTSGQQPQQEPRSLFGGGQQDSQQQDFQQQDFQQQQGVQEQERGLQRLIPGDSNPGQNQQPAPPAQRAPQRPVPSEEQPAPPAEQPIPPEERPIPPAEQPVPVPPEEQPVPPSSESTPAPVAPSGAPSEEEPPAAPTQ